MLQVLYTVPWLSLCLMVVLACTVLFGLIANLSLIPCLGGSCVVVHWVRIDLKRSGRKRLRRLVELELHLACILRPKIVDCNRVHIGWRKCIRGAHERHCLRWIVDDGAGATTRLAEQLKQEINRDDEESYYWDHYLDHKFCRKVKRVRNLSEDCRKLTEHGW